MLSLLHCPDDVRLLITVASHECVLGGQTTRVVRGPMDMDGSEFLKQKSLIN